MTTYIYKELKSADSNIKSDIAYTTADVETQFPQRFPMILHKTITYMERNKLQAELLKPKQNIQSPKVKSIILPEIARYYFNK